MFSASVGLCVPVITCTVITSHRLLPCEFTLVDLTAALSTGVATMSNLAQIRVSDTEERQCRRHDTRLTKSRNTKSEQLRVMPKE